MKPRFLLDEHVNRAIRRQLRRLGTQTEVLAVMKATVKKEGVLIPRRLLKGVKEVEIRKEHGRIIVLPIPAPNDPIFGLGRKPVKSGVSNASERHDDYLYGDA